MATPIDPLPPAPAPRPALVGRERELAILGERLAAARAGQGSLVLIEGEAGIGKTALAAALGREAASGAAPSLEGRCYDLSETPPYGLWFDLFQHDRTADRVSPLPMLFAQWGTGPPASPAPAARQVLEYLGVLAARAPAVLLLDDVHWADPASLIVLRTVARALPDLPLLLLVSYRSDELTRHHPLYTLLPLLEREAPTTRLTLRPLSKSELGALVRSRYALPSEETARLAAYLQRRAEGNAFFATQLLEALEERKILRRGSGCWVLGELDQLGMPPPLRQVLDGRLARLTEDAQALLAVAAVLGQEVPLTLWAAVAAATDDALLDTMEEAVAARLLEATADGLRVRFVHALIREALYDRILPPRRRRWHLAAGEVLAKVPAVDPDAVAYHFRQARDKRAVAWLIRAGERARHATANRSALDRYDAALGLLDEENRDDSPARGWLLLRRGYLRRTLAGHSVADLDAAARIACDTEDSALNAAAHYYRGIALANEADVGRGVAEMRTGLSLLTALSSSEQQRVWGALGSTLDHARGALILFLALTGRFAEARDAGERDAPGDTVLGTWFLGLGYAYAALGEPDAADESMRRAFATDTAGHHFSQLGVDYLASLTWLLVPYYADDSEGLRRLAAAGTWAWEQANRAEDDTQPPGLAWLPVWLFQGQWDEIDRLRPALNVSNSSFQALVSNVLGPFARDRGEAAIAWEWVRAILPQGPEAEPGGTLFFAGVRMQRLAAALALDSGDLLAARAWLTAHDHWLAWSGAVLGQAEGALVWAQLYRAEGNIAPARAAAEQALVHAADPRQPLALIAAHRFLGILDAEDRRFADAEAHLAQSLQLADACAAPFERALTLFARAELEVAAGKPDEARPLLAGVREVCEPLGARPTLERAARLATRLANDPAMKRSRYPAGLSDREVEVLRLVAAGHTNREIARRLYLGERTVQTHLRSILTKTETPNRTAAALFARDHGLA